ncbi:amino acid adenylation domain-containing protein [Herbidospora galbida]|uniref:Amino acid adenylation domain-containing protein n=1 Tax=Herbidospora galbida TaxID=2575442 RepID=A0A4V5UZT8_9ACTN|nr:non-ribosomal peptide synthetase [Herbidospora galbida]TKK88783.1 amino acid adenylation domain-containing protein [Herbidospora galbida]
MSRVPLSVPQSGIWFNERLGGAGAVHHMPFAIRFSGDLDVDALRHACAGVVTLHPALRAAVREEAGAPYQVEGPPVPFEIIETDPDRLAGARREAILRPFDLAAGPLTRITLFRLGPAEHELLVVAHHLVFDGHSTDVFVADLARLYGQAVPVTAPEPFDVAAEARRVAEGLTAARAYWSGRPTEFPDVVLPGLDRPDDAVQPGESVEFFLTEPILEKAAAQLGVTRFELVVASVHAMLFRYGNAHPVTALDLGTRQAGAGERIGVHVNELPFTSDPRADLTFTDYARQVRAGLRELYRVREVPLGRAAPGTRPGIALAPVSLTYRRRIAPPEFPGLRTEVTWVAFNHVARNALRFHLVDGPDGLGVMLQFPPASMPRQDAERVAAHLLDVLRHVTDDPAAPLAALPVAEEPAGLWSTRAYPGASAVPDLVAAQATRTPDAVAVVGENRLTYRELIERSDAVADRLRRAGVRPGDLVAISASRSERLVTGVLGIWRAGASYLPLDPAYPAERLDYVLADSGATALLADAGSDLSGPVRVPLDLPAPAIDGSDRSAGHGGVLGDRAYVIYTSGSTGRPKGVEVGHAALTNLLLSMRDETRSGPSATWLAVTSLSFDISGLELWLPLITGGRVVVATEAQAADGEALRALVSAHGVTHVQATPSTWRLLADAGFEAPVTALVGGEALPLPLATRLRPRVARLLNVYGPTETTIWSAVAEVPPDPDRISIGGPLAATGLLVLDDDLRPVPTGVPGELYITGAGLARGYLGRPALTAERFLPCPFGAEGARMYRTGDRVRVRDGGLEFLGRTDDQVKVRGHRIELGEIEAVLLGHAREAAVAVHDEELVAYTVGAAGDLRREAARVLPAYMVPSAFVALDRMPLTPNGKLDRAALPAPDLSLGDETGTASDETAEVVREIWEEVLGLDHIGDDESLFELGGHSLTIARIAARIHDRLGVDVPFYVFFDVPTVAGIAADVADRRAGS